MATDQDMIDDLLEEEDEAATAAKKAAEGKAQAKLEAAAAEAKIEAEAEVKAKASATDAKPEKKVMEKPSSVSGDEMSIINDANSAEEAREWGSFRGDINAKTIGRLMGLATTSELRVLEGKIDLMVSKIANITVRMDKALQLMADASTGSDLERIDVQIAAMRTYMAQALGDVAAEKAANSDTTKTGQNIKTADTETQEAT